MRSPWIGLLIVAAMLQCWAAPEAGAVNLESLVMPGPVIEGHAKYENECRNCHTPFAKEAQRGLCLDCHDKVAGDIRERVGFHGRFAPAGTNQCATCHTDHEGRQADITRLDPQTFDHALTDFRLAGAHLRAACEGCHEPARKHREAPAACNGCHADDDPHRTALGEDCATCHNDASWTETRFDHGRATDYPLSGAHATVDCLLCHPAQRYKETPIACVACHRIDDVHRGERGAACQDCHDTKSWQKTSFDHLRETGFALTGGHAEARCEACHAGNDFKQPLKSDCVACHRSDDVHGGRNGAVCQDCHATKSWADVKFDHATTKFPLRGAHAALTCVACHKGAVQAVKLDVACIACHAGDDVHAGALGTDCMRCHGNTSWTGSVAFDHDFTRFPLVGLHATVTCESCHVDKRYRDTPRGCADCHGEDDAHKGALGTACADCHNPNDWRIWTFDHGRQTDFPLDGAHAELRCQSCHTRPLAERVPLPGQCVDCHRRDDIHNGQFGGDCARCHTTRSFSGGRRMQ